MRRMKKLVMVLSLALVATWGAPQAFAEEGGIEMPGNTNTVVCGGIEMPGVTCPTPSVTCVGGIEMPGFAATISIILSTLI